MTADLAARAGRGVRELWHTDDQFARQLGDPSHADVIRWRWDAFAAALRSYFAENPDTQVFHVLDAGCGDGINLMALRRILNELGRPSTLVAIDLNPVRVERARAAERAGDRIAFGSVTELPFESGRFDVVLCNHVLEHIARPEQAASEIARVLCPGGMAIVGVPNEGCVLGQLRNHVLQRSILKATDHVNFFTRATLRHLLISAGLDIAAVRSRGFFLPHLRLLNCATAYARGRRILDRAGRLFESQAADLLFIAYRNRSRGTVARK